MMTNKETLKADENLCIAQILTTQILLHYLLMDSIRTYHVRLTPKQKILETHDKCE